MVVVAPKLQIVSRMYVNRMNMGLNMDSTRVVWLMACRFRKIVNISKSFQYEIINARVAATGFQVSKNVRYYDEF